MKKYILLLTLLFSLTVVAQEHFSFMGIPIDGKITKFEKELKKKGFIVKPGFDILPKELLMDFKVFSGLFSQDFVDLMVKYDKNTKVVYEISIHINYSSMTSLEEGYESYYSRYKSKYMESIFMENKTTYHPGVVLAIKNKENNDTLGLICLSKNADMGKDSYVLCIQYIDKYNFTQTSRDSDDL